MSIIEAERISVGLNIQTPKCIDDQPILLIKESCSDNFGKPVDSVIIFVDEKDKFLKTKDMHGEITAVTSSPFGSYIIMPPFEMIGSITLQVGSDSVVVPSWSGVGRKKFAEPTNTGFIKYKSHLKRAV